MSSTNSRTYLVNALLTAIQLDRANRYALLSPWTLPKLAEAIPDYEDDLFLIRDSVITVKPYSGNVCDGATLAPDRIGSWQPVIGAIFHDPWYERSDAMAVAWGWPAGAVRKLGDRIFYGILLEVTPGWLARIYYRAVRVFGGIAHFVMQAAAVAIILSICCAGCSGCTGPDSPWDDPSGFVLPEYEQTAGGGVAP